MLEDRQPRRQGWQAVTVNLAEALFQKRLVNRLRQPHQFVLHVDHLVETGPEEVLFSSLAPFNRPGHLQAPESPR